MLALVDCNNFYASCERVFNPSLVGHPIIVLSNNDGCVIARSNEAKEIGIKMGVPAFEIKEVVAKHNVAVFSSNYTLYGDMSNRVMTTLRDFSPSLEIYSIDEAFLDFNGFEAIGMLDHAAKMRKTVFQNTGIPVSVGIANTKTLAKIANRIVKKKKLLEGVLFLQDERYVKRALQITEVEDIWGVGRKYAKKLRYNGINTAYDLTQKSDSWVKREMSVVGLRMVKELRGEPCLDLELVRQAKKSIVTSRSFGNLITDYPSLAEAVSNFAASCSAKLRSEHSRCSLITVFITTNPFRENDPQYYNSQTVNLTTPSSFTPELITMALKALSTIFLKGYSYKKAGVMVSGITPDSQIQLSLFSPKDIAKEIALMKTLDTLNHRYGRNALQVAAQGYTSTWKLKQEKISAAFTTKLEDIIIADCH
jgi:DNA polymerase V